MNEKRRAIADSSITKVIELCNEMIRLADCSDDSLLDDDCAVFNNVLRDSAYKIRRQAKNELARHETIQQ